MTTFPAFSTTRSPHAVRLAARWLLAYQAVCAVLAVAFGWPAVAGGAEPVRDDVLRATLVGDGNMLSGPLLLLAVLVVAVVLVDAPGRRHVVGRVLAGLYAVGNTVGYVMELASPTNPLTGVEHLAASCLLVVGVLGCVALGFAAAVDRT